MGQIIWRLSRDVYVNSVRAWQRKATIDCVPNEKELNESLINDV